MANNSAFAADMATEPTEKTETEVTPAPVTETDKPLDFKTAGDILNQAGAAHQSKTGDALADAEERDPLAEPSEADPLAASELDDLLADEVPPVTEPEPEPATEAPVTEPEPVTEPAKGGVDLSKLPPRVAAIIRHSEATGSSYEDAEAVLFGTAAETKTEPEPVAQFDFAAAEAELTKLKADRREAGKDFTNPEKAIELTEKIEEKQRALSKQEALAELRAAETARETKTTQGQYADIETQTIAAMGAAFPGAFEPGNPLHDAVLADQKLILQRNPAFFNDADWAETLVRKHASRLGVVEKKPVATATATTATTVAKPVVKPKQPARPLPAPGGRSATQPQTTDADISKAIKEAGDRGDTKTLDFILKTGRLPAAA